MAAEYTLVDAKQPPIVRVALDRSEQEGKAVDFGDMISVQCVSGQWYMWTRGDVEPESGLRMWQKPRHVGYRVETAVNAVTRYAQGMGE